PISAVHTNHLPLFPTPKATKQTEPRIHQVNPMCQSRIAYWSCTSTHMRARTVTYCDEAIVEDFWDPSACSHYHCIYAEHAEKTLCPFCSKVDGFTKLACQTAMHSSQGTREWLSSEDGTAVSPPPPPVLRPLSTISNTSSTSSCVLELPACPVGKHDLSENNEGGILCRLCGHMAHAPSPWDWSTVHTGEQLSSVPDRKVAEDNGTGATYREPSPAVTEVRCNRLRRQDLDDVATPTANAAKGPGKDVPTPTPSDAAWGDLEWTTGHPSPEW
ncbi:hypothetical protein K431DRAFT_326119, partial [Polychaeton citri CBS 116435]